MNPSHKSFVFKLYWTIIVVLFPIISYAQNVNLPKAKTGAFWEHVQFGGGIGLSISTNYTDVTIAPSAIYNFDNHFALGTGLQYSKLKQKDFYSSDIVGGNVIGLYNPLEEIQLSLEVEQVHVSNTYTAFYNNIQKSFWNTGLYLGGGYREGGVTIGARYNVLFDQNKEVYGSAFMPFVRVYF